MGFYKICSYCTESLLWLPTDDRSTSTLASFPGHSQILSCSWKPKFSPRLRDKIALGRGYFHLVKVYSFSQIWFGSHSYSWYHPGGTVSVEEKPFRSEGHFHGHQTHGPLLKFVTLTISRDYNSICQLSDIRCKMSARLFYYGVPWLKSTRGSLWYSTLQCVNLILWYNLCMWSGQYAHILAPRAFCT